MGNPPGTYCIEFHDGIANVHICEGMGLENLKFDAATGSESTFTFEIVESEHTFSNPPITWLTQAELPTGTPNHIQVTPSDGGSTVVTIHVTPPQASSEQEHRFQFNFEPGGSVMPADPTIVEKPPTGNQE